MARYIFLSGLLFNFFVLFSQNKIDSILSLKPKETNFSYSPAFYIKFGFQSPKVIDSNLPETDPKYINKVVLVYTKNKHNSNFDQKALNRKRLKNAQKIFKPLFDIPLNKWEVYEEAGFDNPIEAKKQFHGIIFYTESNINDIEEGLHTAKLHTIKKGGEVKYYYEYANKNDDTVVLEVFDRKINDWENAVAVIDATGSMYPYILQALVWIKLHYKHTHLNKFVFFNDGDDHPDGPVGDSGGCYYIKGHNVNEVTQVAYQTINKGNGGDNPENDLEAVLFGIDHCPKCSSVVLVADNNSSVRDIALLDKITKPVHIILCGTKGNEINPQYLDIARKTNGSVHTIESDLEELGKLAEGDKITIEGQTFIIRNGKFVPR